MVQMIRTSTVVPRDSGNEPATLSGQSTYASPRGTQDLVTYLADFGLTLADLEPNQMLMFVAARNAAGFVQHLEIPVAPQWQRDEGSALREQESEMQRRAAAYFADYLPTRVPNDEMQIGLIQGSEDLPRILPAQWLLEEVCPTAFYAKFPARELFMPRWQQATGGAREADDEAESWELMDELAAAQSTRQHAYVLLDTSRSMNDRDRRGTVARGLALAFLLHGQDQQAQLHVRPFTAQVSELSCGAGQADFQAITRRLIELPNAGQTRIQPALEQATSDIRRLGSCRRADILLITDGLSRLSRNPLLGEKLHTFILGDLPKKDRESGTAATLKDWSQSFYHLWQREFTRILIPRPQDLRAAAGVLERALQQSHDASAAHTIERLRRISDNLHALVAELDRLGNETSLSPSDRDACECQLKRAARIRARCPAGRSSKQADRSVRHASLEWLRGLTGGGLADGFGDQVGLGRYLRPLLAGLIKLLGRALRPPLSLARRLIGR